MCPLLFRLCPIRKIAGRIVEDAVRFVVPAPALAGEKLVSQNVTEPLTHFAYQRGRRTMSGVMSATVRAPHMYMVSTSSARILSR